MDTDIETEHNYTLGELLKSVAQACLGYKKYLFLDLGLTILVFISASSMLAYALGFKFNKGSTLVHLDSSKAVLLFIFSVGAEYIAKGSDRFAYGIVEITFAILSFLTFYNTADSNTSIGVFYLAIGAFIYVGVRGLENVMAGVKAASANIRPPFRPPPPFIPPPHDPPPAVKQPTPPPPS